MNRHTVHGWAFFTLLMSSLVLSFPQQPANQITSQYLPLARQSAQMRPQQAIEARYDDDAIAMNTEYDRKFAEKSNVLKKVALDDIDEDIQTNQIQDNAFSWTNMLASMMTMFFNNQNLAGPNKSDDIDNGIAPSPWANVISVGELIATMQRKNNPKCHYVSGWLRIFIRVQFPLSTGLKIITSLLGGGGGGSDGIDKVDNGGSPMQVSFRHWYNTQHYCRMNLIKKNQYSFRTLVRFARLIKPKT